MNRVLIAGCGDIGRRVARLWREKGVPVCALARSSQSARRLETLGITPVAGNLDEPESLACLLGVPRPPAMTMAEARRVLSQAMLSYLSESKRVDNRKMREELGVTLLYPTLESGLAASRDGEEQAGFLRQRPDPIIGPLGPWA